MPTNSKAYYLAHKDEYYTSPKNQNKSKLRHRARRLLEKAGRLKPNDGKNVDHIDGNPSNNSLSNLRVTSEKRNKKL